MTEQLHALRLFASLIDSRGRVEGATRCCLRNQSSARGKLCSASILVV